MIKTKLKAFSNKINQNTLLFWGGAGLVLVVYYLMAFGIEPLSKNLFGNYTRRIEYTYLGKVRTNVPFTPDKFVTLLSLGSILIQLLLVWAKTKKIASNIITRILFTISILGLIPIGLYLMVYVSLLLVLAILFFVFKGLVRWILRGPQSSQQR